MKDVFNSPAFQGLLQLEAEGVRFRLATHGAVEMAPVSSVPAHAAALLRTHVEDVRLLVAIGTDRGLQDRRDRFRELADASRHHVLPPLVYVADMPAVRGVCFSCGDRLSAHIDVGRCWRCAIAMRLVIGAPITAADAAWATAA